MLDDEVSRVIMKRAEEKMTSAIEAITKDTHDRRATNTLVETAVSCIQSGGYVEITTDGKAAPVFKFVFGKGVH